MRRFLSFLVILLFSILFASAAWADEPAAPEFTFQKALEEAKAHSKSLQLSNYDVDRTYEVQKNAGENVQYVPIGPSSGPDPESNAATGYKKAALNWEIAKKDHSTQEDTTEMQTLQLYDGLLQAIEKVKATEAQLKDAVWKHRIAAASYQVGLIDKTSMAQADSAQEIAKTGLEAAKKSLDDSYQKFNQLVGLNPEERPVLVDNPKFEVLNVENLYSEVERLLDQNPEVWAAEQQIALAKFSLDTFNFNSSGDPYEAKQIDVDKAAVTAGDTKEKARKAIRTLYYTVKQLEQQYIGALEDVKSAEEALRVVRIKYDVGMATQADVAAAESTLEQKRQSVVNYACQHEINAAAFHKPWAAASSTS